MKISGFNKNIFRGYYTTGYDSKQYERMLEPYKDVLNEITEGYDVGIGMGTSFYLHDAYHDEMVQTYPTVVTIEPSKNSAYLTIPKIELYVNHDANPCFGRENEVKDIINAIKKAVSIFKK